MPVAQQFVILKETEHSTRLFPEKDEEVAITCLALTKDFLIYANAKGSIQYFLLSEWTFVNEYPHYINITLTV